MRTVLEIVESPLELGEDLKGKISDSSSNVFADDDGSECGIHVVWRRKCPPPIFSPESSDTDYGSDSSEAGEDPCKCRSLWNASSKNICARCKLVL